MESNNRLITSSPLLVAVTGWLLPGTGYLLLGQRGRAMGIGITIVVLFVLGLLVAGVRVIEVPGYDVTDGEKVMVTITAPVIASNGKPEVDSHGAQLMAPVQDPQTRGPMKRWALEIAPLGEIRDKPWSVPQALAGPIALLSAAWSVHAAAVDPSLPKYDSSGEPISKIDLTIGAVSHSRINEIGSLYLSVAGLLNLMAIIDSTWRASHLVLMKKEMA